MVASVATLSSLRRASAKQAPPGLIQIGHVQNIRREVTARKAPRQPRISSHAAVEIDAKHLRYELRSTVRYRVEGRAYTGIVVAIAHSEPLRYDIRRVPTLRKTSGSADRVSFAVPHEDIDGLLSPPPDDHNLIVLSDLPPETPMALGKTVTGSRDSSFLSRIFRMTAPR